MPHIYRYLAPPEMSLTQTVLVLRQQHVSYFTIFFPENFSAYERHKLQHNHRPNFPQEKCTGTKGKRLRSHIQNRKSATVYLPFCSILWHDGMISCLALKAKKVFKYFFCYIFFSSILLPFECSPLKGMNTQRSLYDFT